jgi:3-hydroxybutyrate dehydrogenase/3-oxoacyl-[acyl-carrier protein] reductase
VDLAPGAAAMGMEFEDWVNLVTQIAMTKKVNEASQVGAMCAFLCSEAGAGITGAMLNVDGGATPYLAEVRRGLRSRGR